MTEPTDEQVPSSWLRDGFTLLEIIFRVAGMLLSKQLKGAFPALRSFLAPALAPALALATKQLKEAIPALCLRYFIPILAALLFFGAMFWAKGRDPFQRLWFKIKAPGCGKTECVAVLPKMAPRPLPVIVYSHGAGGSWLTSGNELRQMAEMGLAAIDMDYNQTNEAAFDAQFAGLLQYVDRQPWADTNRIAWVGFSLGAQRQLAYFLKHPGMRPKLLVRVSGGWVPELDGISNSSLSSLPVKNSSEMPSGARPHVLRESFSILHSPFSISESLPHFLLLHGEHDDVFPVSDARRIEAVLQSNGVPVDLKIIPGQGHGFEPNRLLLFRVIGEYCLTHLNGPEALANYQSILSWQAKAKPLWLFWIPALLWAALRCWLLYRNGHTAKTSSTEPPTLTEVDKPNTESGKFSILHSPFSIFPRWEIALRWVAGLLAVAAVADTALHLVPPRLAISGRTIAIAQKHLVQPKEMADFEYLVRKAESRKQKPEMSSGRQSGGADSEGANISSIWAGKRLKTLLEHVELANYNRELIDWKLDDQNYRDFVLSPQIDPEFDGDLNWRRPLWENFYPRIRKEPTTEDAAVIVARFLRERVTVQKAEMSSGGHPGGGDNVGEDISAIWERQIADERGFEAVYVAAMRSAGIPARLDGRQRAEFWTGSAWRPAPRPPVETW